jgi:hypothetical protein
MKKTAGGLLSALPAGLLCPKRRGRVELKRLSSHNEIDSCAQQAWLKVIAKPEDLQAGFARSPVSDKGPDRFRLDGVDYRVNRECDEQTDVPVNILPRRDFLRWD